MSRLLLLFCLVICGCQPVSREFVPNISYFPHPCINTSRDSAFDALTPKEAHQEWGKELIIAQSFSYEMDLYRAITAYKRAFFLLPPKETTRRIQIEYCIMQAYYMGYKYDSAAEAFETSRLLKYAESTFPAYRDLLIMLYECYVQTNQCEKHENIGKLIEELDCALANDLNAYSALRSANFESLAEIDPGPNNSDYSDFTEQYCCAAKSVEKARFYNAVIPGAGYLYVGQKKTALTSLVINSLFIAAAYCFFDHGNIPAALITTSLEMGWYFGGINGAGIAAEEYNQRLYEVNAKEVMVNHRLFPILMIGTSF